MKNKISTFIATSFYTGKFPIAPGTFSSFFIGVPLTILISHIYGENLLAPQLIIFALVMIIGTITTHYEGIRLNETDAKSITIDEIAGMLISTIPARGSIAMILAGFVFFRIFDIAKPWPVSYFDKKVKNAIGVMMDDVMAGIYAFICLMILLKILY